MLHDNYMIAIKLAEELENIVAYYEHTTERHIRIVRSCCSAVGRASINGRRIAERTSKLEVLENIGDAIEEIKENIRMEISE